MREELKRQRRVSKRSGAVLILYLGTVHTSLCAPACRSLPLSDNFAPACCAAHSTHVRAENCLRFLLRTLVRAHSYWARLPTIVRHESLDDTQKAAYLAKLSAFASKARPVGTKTATNLPVESFGAARRLWQPSPTAGARSSERGATRVPLRLRADRLCARRPAGPCPQLRRRAAAAIYRGAMRLLAAPAARTELS